MIVHLPDGIAVLVSSVAWLLIGVITGFALHKMSVGRFDHDSRLTRERAFEDHGRWYQRRLRIRSWKDRLPEKGDLFRGGFSKRHLASRSSEHIERFVAETRRAETVHWSNLCAGPVFLIWCRPLLGALMIMFGVLAHLPFIAVQRYNRARLNQLLSKRRLTGRFGDPSRLPQ